MERSPKRDFIGGLFVLAGVAAIAYLSINVGGLGRHGRSGLRLYASFDETGNLTTRAPVVIAGVRVGQVERISLDQNFRAKVEMNLDPDLKLPEDTFAAIVTAGVLGDRYIELSPGGEEKLLKSGETITHTESAVVLEQLIKQFIYGSSKSGKSGAGAATTQP